MGAFYYIGQKERSYHFVNGLFILTILLVLLYSFLFTGTTHPIPALLTEVTGIIPPSKGLSQSFSEIVRGNLSNAENINPYSVRVFFFFAIQLLLRIFFSLLIRIKPGKIKVLALSDSAISAAFFFWSFAPLITYTLNTFRNLVL